MLACAASMLTYIHRYSWGVIRSDIQQETKFDDIQMGWLDAGFNLTYAVGQVPGGFAGDVYGPRLLITLSILIWSLFVIGPTLIKSFWGLLGIRAGFGAAQAPCYPNLGKVTANWFPENSRTAVQGTVATLCGRGGAALAPIIISTLLIGKFGLTWREAILVITAVGIVFGILFWLYFRNNPTEDSRVNQAEVELIKGYEASRREPSESTSVKLDLTPEKKWNMGWLMLASCIGTFADNLYVFYLPTYLTTEKHMDSTEMGIYASLPLIGGALGGWVGGFLNDALIKILGSRKTARRVVAGGGKVIAFLLILVALQFDNAKVMMVILGCSKFFTDMTQPTWWGTVTDIGGPAAGRVFGIANLCGSLGAFIAGPIMGAVKQHMGWNALFMFVGILYVVAAIVWSRVDCEKRMY